MSLKFATIAVECGIHGPMKYRFPLDWWECVGFDGEGCCKLIAEEAYDLLQYPPIPVPEDSPLLPVKVIGHPDKPTRIVVKDKHD
jgi:hypothetical protein